MASKIDRYLILSGFLGPVVFALVILTAGALYPGYDHENQVISDLGAVGSPVKDFMNIFGFMLFGLFIVAFSAGVYRIRTSLLGKLIALLFALGGIGMFLIGVFPSDEGHKTVDPHRRDTRYGDFFPVLRLVPGVHPAHHRDAQ